jgi:heme/copper-type cytochrome/quinol oxidase subunit 1
MGAVFSVFGGFYYWIGKMTGYQYSELLGQIQFWLTFIGVNLTFFPQHFVGLAGFPRRYGDYPDSYVYWNEISSFGSQISFVGMFLFLYIIYHTLASSSAPLKSYYWSHNDLWNVPSAIPSLEWTQLSPPLHHTHLEAPISILSKK